MSSFFLAASFLDESDLTAEEDLEGFRTGSFLILFGCSIFEAVADADFLGEPSMERSISFFDDSGLIAGEDLEGVRTRSCPTLFAYSVFKAVADTDFSYCSISVFCLGDPSTERSRIFADFFAKSKPSLIEEVAALVGKSVCSCIKVHTFMATFFIVELAGLSRISQVTLVDVPLVVLIISTSKLLSPIFAMILLFSLKKEIPFALLASSNGSRQTIVSRGFLGLTDIN